MKFIFTPRFSKDYKKSLSPSERRDVKNSKKTIQLALEGNTEYFKMHRIKMMEGHPYIWEGHVKENLCFTFHYGKTELGEKTVFFRRVGTQKIYENP